MVAYRGPANCEAPAPRTTEGADAAGVAGCLTQADTVKLCAVAPHVAATRGGAGAERKTGFATLRAPEESPKTPEEKLGPAGTLVVKKAAVPSALEPEKKKAVSVGPAAFAAAGAQPDVEEEKLTTDEAHVPQTAVPPKLYALAAHAEQPLAFVVPGLKTAPANPAAQTAQAAIEVLPGPAVVMPGGHGEQLVAPVAAKVPAVQAAHEGCCELDHNQLLSAALLASVPPVPAEPAAQLKAYEVAPSVGTDGLATVLGKLSCGCESARISDAESARA